MKTFASTYVPGFGKVVHEHLAKMFRDAQITNDLEGMIVYKTHANANMVKSVRFFNNSFLVYHEFQEADMAKMLRGLAETFILDDDYLGTVLNTSRTFKLVFSDERTNAKLTRSLIAKFENRISTFTNLLATKEKGDVEFWFLNRSEGYGFFGLRLTDRRVLAKHVKTKDVQSGLAHLMCLLSEPAKTDVFLDPFSGTGSIPYERAQVGGYKQIIAMESDPKNVSILKSNLQYKNLVVKEAGVSDLSEVQAASVDKIVTQSDAISKTKIGITLEESYERLLHETKRILRPQGVAVFLTKDKDEFVSALGKLSSGLSLKENYNVVVEDSDRGVYKLVKDNAGSAVASSAANSSEVNEEVTTLINEINAVAQDSPPMQG